METTNGTAPIYELPLRETSRTGAREPDYELLQKSECFKSATGAEVYRKDTTGNAAPNHRPDSVDVLTIAAGKPAEEETERSADD